ncbi:type II toxin-antitoxin system HigA family antitoxin [Bacteroidota bacterium]
METVAATTTVTVSLIKTDEQLDEALAEIGVLLDLDDTTPEQEDKIELLSLVIEAYESKRFQFEKPDPVDMIEFAMDQHNLRQRDLIPILGSRSRVSEILTRKRRLTLKMMRALHSEYHIPLELLVQEYPLTPHPATPSDSPAPPESS